jgi:hypothetical protein
MGDPDHQKWYKCWTFEEALYFFEVERLRAHRRRLLWQIGNDSLTLVLGKKFDCLRVIRQVEKGVDSTEDGGNAFQDKKLSSLLAH